MKFFRTGNISHELRLILHYKRDIYNIYKLLISQLIKVEENLKRYLILQF